MQHKIKYLSQAQIELEVSLSSEEMAYFWQLAKEKVVESANLKGFRKKNIPEEFIKNTDLEERIFDEAANSAFKKSINEITKELELELVGLPEVNIKKIVPNNEFVYVFKSAILPKPELKNYKEVSRGVFKEKKQLQVSNKEIDDAINWLQKSRAKIIAVNRPAQKNDLVEIETKCFCEGKEVNDFPSTDQFILAEGRYIPGFEEELEGLKVGETKEFKIFVPDDYWNEALKSKELTFQVKINRINERQLPELNDEWATTLGQFNNLEELRQSIKEGLFQEKEIKEKERLRLLLLERLIEQNKVELPEILVESEIENQIHLLKHFIEEKGLNFDDYLKKINKTEDDLRKDLYKEAEKTLKGFIILRTIAKLENCLPTPEEIEEGMRQILNQKAMGGEDINKIDKEALMEYIKERLTNEKVFQFLENQI